MHPLKTVLSSLAILIFALVPSISGAYPVLLITESSSTALTVTVDGSPMGTVENIGSDTWFWHSGIYGFGTGKFSFASQYWTEPGGETGVNFVDDYAFGYDPQMGGSEMGLFIQSEYQQGAIFPVPDGAYGFGLYFIDTSSNFDLFDVYFSDLGDAGNAVPESSSTICMLFLSSAAIIVVTRLRPSWVP